MLKWQESQCERIYGRYAWPCKDFGIPFGVKGGQGRILDTRK